jgi:hypothetical protein
MDCGGSVVAQVALTGQQDRALRGPEDTGGRDAKPPGRGDARMELPYSVYYKTIGRPCVCHATVRTVVVRRLPRLEVGVAHRCRHVVPNARSTTLVLAE